MAVPVAIGLALIALGTPRSIAAWSTWRVSSTLESLKAEKLLADGELARAKANLDEALQWQPSSPRLTSLATIEIMEAAALKSDDRQRQVLLTRAERHVTDALAHNPGSAVAWLSLARVWMLKGEDRRRVADALMESLHAGPGTRTIWVERADLLMRLWRVLDESEFQVLQSQLSAIATASANDRARLFDAALALGELRLAAAAAASNDPSARESLDQMKRELLSASRKKGL